MTHRIIRLLGAACLVAGLGVPAQAQTETCDSVAEVAILVLNDFHGAFVRNDALGVPGAANVLQTIDSLRSVYPHSLVVSAGDNFGGSYFYNATGGVLLPVFFHEAGIRISAVGNHEFDDGQERLAAKWAGTPLRPAGWDMTYVCANVLDSTRHIPACMQPYTAVDLPLSATKSVRVALVGLLSASAKEQISSRRIAGMQFRGDYTCVLDELESIPGFDAVREAPVRVLLMHIGSQMQDGRAVWFDKRADELEKLDGTRYQAFITSHTHDSVCGRINTSRTPVTQGQWHGNYIGVMKFRLDTVRMRVVSAEPALVRVPLRPVEALTPHAARLQAQVDSLLTHTRTAGGTPIGAHLTTAARSLAHNRADLYSHTEVGRLVCASYARAFAGSPAGRQLPPDTPVVGVSHFGSVRAGFTKGPVSVLEVGEVLPFNNRLRVFRTDGRLLRELLDFGNHNQRYGWMQYAALDVEQDGEGRASRIVYTDPATGRRTPVTDTTVCYVVADEFMSNGGDGYDKRFFPADREISVELPHATDAFIEYLKGRESIGE